MSQLSADATAILEQLKKLQRPVVELLRPGHSVGVISQKLAACGLEPSRELEELWSWRNGTLVAEGTILDDLHFFPGFYLMSLEDSVEQYSIMRDDARWSSCWLPIFANGGGDFYATVLGRSQEEAAPVVGFVLGADEQDEEYRSIGSMFRTLRDCYEQGVFWLTDDGYLEMDDLKYVAIARIHNPGNSIWFT
jgi:hypothetical protein